MKKTLRTSVFAMVATAVAVTSVQAASLTDISGHWAEKVIIQAAEQKGYVSGYPDGTFRPNLTVSKAEFIKLITSALALPTGEQGANWYDASVAAAKQAGLYADEFGQGKWDTPITREEMAMIAVRALGESPANVYEGMLAAVKHGLITGVGNGDLAAQGTTTRAQAVTIIERVLQVKAGAALPVDEKAVDNADKAAKAERDPWGRAIRTTNLPKNYKDFPYILEGVPNEMYEMPRLIRIEKHSRNAAEFFEKYPELNKENIDIWLGRLNAFAKTWLNVDYRTIDYTWSEELNKQQLINNGSAVYESNKYVDWVKENKIKVEGTLEPEPSIIYHNGFDIMIRCKFRIRFVEFNERKNLLHDHWFPNDKKFTVEKWIENDTPFEKGVWYEGYADFSMGNNTSGNWGPHVAVSEKPTLFMNFKLQEE